MSEKPTEIKPIRKFPCLQEFVKTMIQYRTMRFITGVTFFKLGLINRLMLDINHIFSHVKFYLPQMTEINSISELNAIFDIFSLFNSNAKLWIKYQRSR